MSIAPNEPAVIVSLYHAAIHSALLFDIHDYQSSKMDTPELNVKVNIPLGSKNQPKYNPNDTICQVPMYHNNFIRLML